MQVKLKRTIPRYTTTEDVNESKKGLFVAVCCKVHELS